MRKRLMEQIEKLENKRLDRIQISSPKELSMKRLPNNVASGFICRNHYTGTCPSNIMLALGFFYEKILTTCIVYAIPPGRDTAQSIWEGGNTDECWELVRLFSHDQCIKNTESYCISQSFKYIKQYFPQIKVLVSYADAKHNHCGFVYQASNWMYIGTGGDSQEFYIKGKRLHTRTAVARYGTASVPKLKSKLGDNFERIELPQKHKYVYILRNKKEIMKKAKFEVQPYPKIEPPDHVQKMKQKRKRKRKPRNVQGEQHND